MSDDAINPRRTGKVARLPRHLREEICRRLDDGEEGDSILAWLNAQPETKALVDAKFDGEPVSHNNLSQWFKGGFQDWLAGQKAVEETKAKMELSLRIAREAGGAMSEGVLAVAAGKIYEVLDTADPDKLVKLVAGATMIRGTEQTKEKIAIARDRTNQRQEIIDLDRKKFELLFVGKFIDFATNQEAIAIATGRQSRQVKTDELLALMFGPRPEATA